MQKHRCIYCGKIMERIWLSDQTEVIRCPACKYTKKAPPAEVEE